MRSNRFISGLALTAALTAGALAGSALASTGANAASLILDGNFNAGTLPTAGQNYYQEYGALSPSSNWAGFNLPGGNWFVLDNNVDVVAPGTGPYAMNTPSGACCSVDLVGTGSTGGMYQTVTAAAGKYTLAFYYANNSYSTASAAANVEVGSSGGGSSNILLTNISHSGSSFPNAATSWTLFTDTFSVLTPGSLTLSFDTTSGAGSGGVVITDVSLSSTPLPAALPLFVGGLGMIGLFAGRKKRKAATAEAA